MENRTQYIVNIDKCSLLVKIIGMIVIVMSLFVIFGLLLDIRIMSSFYSLWVSMKANVAISFLLLGFVILLLTDKTRGALANFSIMAALASVILIGTMTLFEYVSGYDLGIDQLFIKDSFMSPGTMHAGRMAVITAVALVISAIAFASLQVKCTSTYLVQAIAWATTFVTLISLCDYIFGANMQYLAASYLTMALPTTILFFLISMGISLIAPDRGIVEMVLRATSGGYLLRRSLPAIFVVPILLFSIDRWVAATGIIDDNLSHSVIIAIIYVGFGIATSAIALTIDRREKDLQSAQLLNEQNEIIFREFTENIDIVFFKTSPDSSKVLYISPAYEKVWGRKTDDLYTNPKDWFEAILPEHQQSVQETINKEFGQGRSNVALSYHIKRLDGAIREIHARVFQLKDQDDRVFCNIGIAVDITNVGNQKKYLEIKNEVSNILEKNKSLTETAPKILEVICKAFHWELGQVWLIDETKCLLRCVNIWHNETPTMRGYGKLCRNFVFKLGEGLPGRVWKNRMPIWEADYAKQENFSRSDEAEAAGINSVFGLPIIFQDNFYGVMEFFSKDMQDPNQELLILMKDLGSTLAEFVRRVHNAEQLQVVSQHDILTGLMNRSAFVEIIDEAIENAQSKSFSLLLIDIDRFKILNSAFGHNNGNLIIQAVAARLAQVVDTQNHPMARLTAGEFAIAYLDMKTPEDALDYARKLERCFRDPFSVGKELVVLTASTGIVMYPQDGLRCDTLLINANHAVMSSKSWGATNVSYLPKSYLLLHWKKYQLRLICVMQLLIINFIWFINHRLIYIRVLYAALRRLLGGIIP